MNERQNPDLSPDREDIGTRVTEDDRRAIEETLYLLSIPGMKESILEGMNTPLEECSDELVW
jgi:hypothetical protein